MSENGQRQQKIGDSQEVNPFSNSLWTTEKVLVEQKPLSIETNIAARIRGKHEAVSRAQTSKWVESPQIPTTNETQVDYRTVSNGFNLF